MPDATPDTLVYMVLGYVLASVILTGLVLYLFAKSRAIRAEDEMLDQLESENQPNVRR